MEKKIAADTVIQNLHSCYLLQNLISLGEHADIESQEMHCKPGSFLY